MPAVLVSILAMIFGSLFWKDIILSQIVKLCQKDKRTAERYYKDAEQQHRVSQEALNKVKEVQEVENKINELKTASLTKLDRILIAESIAKAKAKKVNGQLMIPSASDQLKALDYISKIEGDYAPTKTANTDVEGKDKDDPLTALIKAGGGKIVSK